MSKPPRQPDPSRDSLLMALRMGPVPADASSRTDQARRRGAAGSQPLPETLVEDILPDELPPALAMPQPRPRPYPGGRPPGPPRRGPVRLPAIQTKLFRDWGVPEWFVVSQAIFFAILFIPGVSMVRLLTKVASFVTSLIALFLIWRKGGLKERTESFKASGLVSAFLGVVVLMFLHPGTNSPVAGLASIVLWTSTYCIAYWSTAALRYAHQLQRVFLLIFLINSTSALLGIGQFYKPNIFLPPSIGVLEAGGLSALIPYYTLDDGTQVLRPCGMTDNPGSASAAGVVAAVMGVVVLTAQLPRWQRLMGLALAVPGATVIYLTQVRTAILMVVLSLMSLIFVMVLQNRWGKAIQIGVAGMIVVLGGFMWAASEGGKSIFDRYMTLVEDSPTEVLAKSTRGQMVSHTLGTMVFEAPVGAGLGRYGQVYGYFGNWAYGDMIWVETQIYAWLIDGGIVLLVLGFATVISAMYDTLRVARTCPSPSVAHWAAGVFAMNMSIFFACFGQMPFLTNIGQQFWLLAGMTHAADRWVRYQRRRGISVP